MGLLDNDAEELKKNSKSTETGSTGRKVNQSGLGVFKGLSKYNNLTSKYRTKTEGTEAPTPPIKSESEYLTVEHHRGTISTSGEQIPKSDAAEVSAKPVESQSEVSADLKTASLPALVSDGLNEQIKSVQSQSEAGAKSVLEANAEEAQLLTESEILAPQTPKVSAKPVQTDSSSTKKPHDQKRPSSDIPNLDADKVGAKSVHPSIEVSANPGQSRSEVGATKNKPLGAEVSVFEVSAKSVQSQSDPSSSLLDDPNKEAASARPEVSAKPVQSQSEVSAESPRAYSRHVDNPQWLHKASRPSLKEAIQTVVHKNSQTTIQSQSSDESASTASHQVTMSKYRPPAFRDEKLDGTQQPHAEPVPTTLEQDSNSAQLTNPQAQSPEIKSVQSQSEVSADPVIKPVQSQSKVGANSVQHLDQTFFSQSKVSSKVRAQVGAKLVRSQCKLEPLEGITSLAGAQKTVIEFLFEQCLWNNSPITPAITKQQLMAGTELSENTAFSAIKRLRKKLIIDRYAYKDGRSGWTQYLLADDSYRELLQLNQLRAKSVQSQSEVGSKVSPKVSAPPSSSSSFLDLTKLKTTTSDPETFENADAQHSSEWLAVDIGCVAEIGFTKHQLAQLIRDGHLTPEEVGNSLAYFAFAYERGDLKKIAKPLGYLMSILRKPSTFPRPDGYETPLEASRRLNLESKRRSEERRQEEERELQDLEFASWRRELTAEEVNAIVPEVVRNLPKGREMALKSHFNEAVWPENRVGILGTFESERADIARQVERSLNFTNQKENF